MVIKLKIKIFNEELLLVTVVKIPNYFCTFCFSKNLEEELLWKRHLYQVSINFLTLQKKGGVHILTWFQFTKVKSGYSLVMKQKNDENYFYLENNY